MARRKFVREILRITGRPLAKVPRHDELAGPLNRGEAVGVPADVFIVAVVLARPFLASDESPNFVGLDIFHRDMMNGRFQESLALLSGVDHRVNDRVPVNPGQPFGRANGVAFQEHPQTEDNLVQGEPATISGPGRFVRERANAGIATIAL